jgi:hypothetical protein
MAAVLLNVVRTENTAVIDCGEVIVTATGFVVVEAAPDHPVNWYPTLGVADNCTEAPAA